jgi:hypothetical protein
LYFTDRGGFGTLKFKESSQKTSILPEYFIGEIENITDTCFTLSESLYLRGLRQNKIYQLVRDVVKVVELGCIFNLSSVNYALESLGWPNQVLNEISFELISEVLYRVFEYEVEVHTVN